MVTYFLAGVQYFVIFDYFRPHSPKLFASKEGILLDPAYSGKSGAGFIDLVRKGFFAEGSNVLFLHTGGSQVLFAYMDTF